MTDKEIEAQSFAPAYGKEGTRTWLLPQRDSHGVQRSPSLHRDATGHPRKEGQAQQAASAIGTDMLLSGHMLRSRVRFYLKKWFAAEGKISKLRHRSSRERPGWPLRNEKVTMTVVKPQEINYPKSVHLISSTK